MAWGERQFCRKHQLDRRRSAGDDPGFRCRKRKSGSRAIGSSPVKSVSWGLAQPPRLTGDATGPKATYQVRGLMAFDSAGRERQAHANCRLVSRPRARAQQNQRARPHFRRLGDRSTRGRVGLRQQLGSFVRVDAGVASPAARSQGIATASPASCRRSCAGSAAMRASSMGCGPPRRGAP